MVHYNLENHQTDSQQKKTTYCYGYYVIVFIMISFLSQTLTGQPSINETHYGIAGGYCHIFKEI